VNDGSIDNSLTIINEFAKEDKRIKIINKQNEGLPFARKSGLALASGDYIFHLDGDDSLPLDAIEKLVISAELTNADIIIGDFEVIAKNEKSTYVYNFSEIDNIDFIRQILTDSFVHNIWGKLIRREIHIKIEIPQLIQNAEDLVAIIQLAYYASKISKCNSSVYYYYLNQRDDAFSSKMTKQNYLQLYEASCFVVDFLQSKEVKALQEVLLSFQIDQLLIYLLNTNITGFYRKDIKLLLKKNYKFQKQGDLLLKFSNNVKILFFIARFSPKVAVFVYKLHNFMFSKLI
jgi:glycosyltransferase involved in cell wall biosynthesis